MKTLRQKVEDCVEEPKMELTPEMKEQYLKRKDLTDEMQMKMAKCMMIKMGFMNPETDEFLKDAMKATMTPNMNDPTKFDKMMETCYKIKDSPGLTARKMLECWIDFYDSQCGC